MRLAVVGINHKTAGLDARGQFSFTPEDAQAALAAWRGAGDGRPDPIGAIVEEMVILSTCNRTEIYVAYACRVLPLDMLVDFFARRKGYRAEDLLPHVYVHDGADAVDHLFRVVSGLDSMVFGEHEVTGQAKRAYETAVACRANGTLTNKLFHAAFRVAHRVRAETGVSRGSTSVSQVACDIVEHHLPDMTGKRVLFVGAGKAVDLAAKRLVKLGAAELIFVNRTLERAEELVAKYGGRAVALDDLAAALIDADVIISATGAPDVVIPVEDARAAQAARPARRYYIDLAVPRDVALEIRDERDTRLYDLDDIREHVARNLYARHKERHQAFRIVEDARTAFVDWHESMKATPVISQLRETAERIRQEELEKIARVMPEDKMGEVEAMTRRLVNKVLHEPIMALKRGDMSTPQHDEVAASIRVALASVS
ncbi:glutamyl-tRNA reductase [bacterium]|nr:glutamyl-tRNA reductase [bacterium]